MVTRRARLMAQAVSELKPSSHALVVQRSIYFLVRYCNDELDRIRFRNLLEHHSCYLVRVA